MIKVDTHVENGIEEACKHKWSVRYPALPECVLIPLNAVHLARTCPPPSHPLLLLLLQLPLLLLDPASITLFLLCHPSPFYEFRVPSISPHPSCYFLPTHSKPSPLSMTTQIPPIPPSSSLSAVCPPGLGRTHDLLILLAGPAHNTQHQYALHSSTQHNSGLLTTHCNPRHTDGGAKPQYGESAF